MSKEKMIDAMGRIDDDLLERYDKIHARLSKKKSPRIKIAATAAVLCMIIGATIPLLPRQSPASPSPTVLPSDPAAYSAQDIADFFAAAKNDSISTNAYTTHEFPSTAFPTLNPLPTDDHLSIYLRQAQNAAPDQEAFSQFISRSKSDLSNALDMLDPDFRQVSIITHPTDKNLYAELEDPEYRLYWSQGAGLHYFYLTSGSDERYPIKLNGQPVQIDQQQTDEQITASLSGIQYLLNAIFKTDLPDVKIVRKYDEYSDHGAQWITVYFYDSSAHPLNAVTEPPVTDYICIEFDNAENYAGDIISDDILVKSSIRCYDFTEEDSLRFTETAQAKLITLSEAEAMLHQGQVFGGHSCELCMQLQDKISFEGYDHVSFTYLITPGNDLSKAAEALPFYVFYKKIRSNDNGTDTYARTYVPAIEIYGIEAHFEAQAQSHPQ